jgi:hypothetical protein
MSLVMDVLSITTAGYKETPEAIRGKEKPFMGNLDVDGVVAFECLPEEVASKVLQTCTFRGFDYPAPTLLFGQAVSLVRRDPPEPEKWDWDQDRRIRLVLHMSRLVHPVPAGPRYAARLWLSGKGEVERALPGHADNPVAHTFCTKGQRWYLTEQDACRTKDTLAKYNANEATFPNRVRQALWRYDYAFCEQYLDLRWLAMSAALEALVHTDKHRSTKQFSVRVAALAGQLAITGWNEQRLADMYHEYRCPAAHGQDITKAEPDVIADYVQFEDLVRRVLLRCVEDVGFCRHFASESSIRGRWPVP